MGIPRRPCHPSMGGVLELGAKRGWVPCVRCGMAVWSLSKEG